MTDVETVPQSASRRLRSSPRRSCPTSSSPGGCRSGCGTCNARAGSRPSPRSRARRPRWSASCAASTSTPTGSSPTTATPPATARSATSSSSSSSCTGAAIPTAAASPTACAPPGADLAWHAGAARGRARVGAQAARRPRRRVHVRRRRRDVGGRLLRGDQPRRRAAGAADRRVHQQRLGDLHPDRAARPRRETFAAKGAARGHPRRARRRQRRARGARGDARRASARRRRVTGRRCSSCVTYRMGAHTNSDDPTRYVPEDELAEWRRAIRSSGS